MEILTAVTVKQFSYGMKLLLPFDDIRADQSTPVNSVSDVWEVAIIKPSGLSLHKTTGLTFPNSNESKIAVTMNSLDLDEKGIYTYQVIRVTDSASVRHDVKAFTVTASIPDDLPPAAPASGDEGEFAVYASTGIIAPAPGVVTRRTQWTLTGNGSLGTPSQTKDFVATELILRRRGGAGVFPSGENFYVSNTDYSVSHTFAWDDVAADLNADRVVRIQLSGLTDQVLPPATEIVLSADSTVADIILDVVLTGVLLPVYTP